MRALATRNWEIVFRVWFAFALRACVRACERRRRPRESRDLQGGPPRLRRGSGPATAQHCVSGKEKRGLERDRQSVGKGSAGGRQGVGLEAVERTLRGRWEGAEKALGGR